MVKTSDASALLEKVGVRSTEPRRHVLEALLGAGGSLSHRELVELLAGLDRVTIYRNLKVLKAAGLVHGVQGVDGVLRYLVNPGRGGGCPGGHAHFLCLECGTMSCLADQALPRIRAPRGAEVRGKQFLVYGLCGACAASSRGRSK
jgi:Fur family transcriptional regulator, ferric uptake regulator